MSKTMLGKLLRKLYQQTLILVVVTIVLVAAYVSLGREFMPYVSRYASFLEEQAGVVLGMPVQVDSLSGNFVGFNPELRIRGLSVPLADTDSSSVGLSSALYFDSATIVLDVGRSLWQRRWVLADFIIEDLNFDLEQDAGGSWRLRGASAGAQGSTDAEALFRTFQRFNRIDLRGVSIHTRNQLGESFLLENGSAIIENVSDQHYVHIDAIAQGGSEPLSLSVEFTGDELNEVDGRLHALFPAGDYGELLRGFVTGQTQISAARGNGELWASLDSGRLSELIARLDLQALALDPGTGSLLRLQDVSGITRLQQSADGWQLRLDDLGLTYGEQYWRPLNLQLEIADQRLDLQADNINLALLRDLGLSSGLLGEGVAEQLAAYAPNGYLRQLALSAELGEGRLQSLNLRSNLDSLEVGSFRGSPNMWGISGYLELGYEAEMARAVGFIEVESQDFSINIPNVFTQVWGYSYVNGRLDFRADLGETETVTLSSGVIVAESDRIDGRVRFRSVLERQPDGSRDAELELIVGAQRLDAASKTPYLPDGPRIDDNLRNSMTFLESAVLDGTIYDSAALYRGSTVPGSGPATKTFQSVFMLEDVQFRFNESWPEIEQLDALVSTSDNDIDVEVRGGGSLGLRLADAAGLIRRNDQGESWLSVQGFADGETAAGLAYLQTAPVDENLKAAFANWQVDGRFESDIEVLVPLNVAGAEPEIRLDMRVAENRLWLPDYELEIVDLTGPIVFDTRTGLENSSLRGDMFGDSVNFNLSSAMGGGTIEALFVEGLGSASPEALIAWPQQSAFVRSLLARMSGQFDYRAELIIDRTNNVAANTRLRIESDLLGAGLNLPQPFAKPEATELPLTLEIGFLEGGQRIRGELQERLQFQLDFANEVLEDGLVYIGEERNQLSSLAQNETDGLVVLGVLDRLVVEEWTDFLAGFAPSDEPGSAFSDSVAFVDVQTEFLSLYGQELADVDLRIEPDLLAQGWLTRLSSEAVQGWVTLPYAAESYLELDLEYLRLPADEDAETPAPETAAVEAGAAELEEDERVDPLVGIDPRNLPPLRLTTQEFSIGERQFGSWQFTLDPGPEGAIFTDLAFDFRGLRLGLDETPADVEQIEPSFRWLYDGSEHRSELSGVLMAGDIGDVLVANGFAESLISDRAAFVSTVDWPGSPAFFAGSSLSGRIDLRVEDGRFLQDAGGTGALKLVSIINLSAIMRRLRFSDDLLRRGLAFDEISGSLLLNDGLVDIQDRLVISGPSSLYQITGEVDLAAETIAGEMVVTLPVSDNIPWLGLLTANLPLAVGAYLFDQIFGDQVDSLTSAVYSLQGPWEGLEPEFKQAFGSPEESPAADQ